MEGEGDLEGSGVDEGHDEEGGDRDANASARPRGRPRGRARGSTPITPAARARGKGRGRGRGRGRGKGLTAHFSGEGGEGEIDGEEGEEAGRAWRRVGDKVYYIEGDEFVTDPDERGDQKIDIDGNLLDGRRFKCSTFILPDRHPTRQYMLAIDAARSSGFRDSLYYFRRNSLALKLSASQKEKEALIQAGKLGAHLKTRSVTLVTARSAYKLHGAKMIIDGRWVTDDYYEDRVLADITTKGLSSGDYVGELPDPLAASASNAPAISAPSQMFSGTNQGVYRAGGPTTLFGGSGWGPFSDGPHSAVRKSMLSREGLTVENWMSEAARRVHELNTEWSKMRQEARIACGGILEGNSSSGKGKERDEMNGAMDVDGEGDVGQKKKTDEVELPLGVYEPHTGLVHYRADTQPTRCRWDQIAPRRVLGGTKVGNGAWALAWVDTCLELPGQNNLDPYVTERDMLMASLS
ncbi:hypothetical protein OG21DRAFT_1408764 [Imleria badia]|nr:hypothetical protein OG21DRAFT_1408764 [Imleria badia]